MVDYFRQTQYEPQSPLVLDAVLLDVYLITSDSFMSIIDCFFVAEDTYNAKNEISIIIDH